MLPGRTAHQVFLTFLLKSAITVAGVLLLVELISQIGLSVVASGLGILLLGLLGLGAIFFRFWSAVGRRSVQEFEAGYTTFAMQYGDIGFGDRRRSGRRGRLTPWNYAGLWVLDGAARDVVSAPDPSIDPPGYYPSPNRRNVFELWTGAVWSGRYRG